MRDTIRLRDRHCILLLAALAAALFRKALFGGAVILSHPVFLDLTHQVFAYRRYGFGLLREGIVPLWNPYNFCGAPFLANWHSAIFYPLNAIFLLLPVHTALNWSIAFHFFLAGALTYAFVRLVGGGRAGALLSAVVFVLSGPYILQLFPGHIFNPLPWLPLALICGEMAVRRRRAVWCLLAGVVLGVQILAGHPQYMAYCAGAQALYILFRAASECRGEGAARPLIGAAAGIALMVATGAALSAVQLLPGLEFAAESGRAGLAGPAAVRDNSLPPENLALLAVPGLFGDMQGVRYWGRWLYWETCIYVGVLPILLAILGAVRGRSPVSRFFAGLALLTLVLAFGAYSPLFGFLYARVPGFSIFRAQAKFAVLAAFSIAVLAGFGLRRLLDGAHPARGSRRAWATAACLLGAGLAFLCAAAAATGGAESPLWGRLVEYRNARGFEGTPPIHPSDTALRAVAYRTALRGGLAAAGLLLVSGGIFFAAGRARPALLAAAVLCVSLGDLWRFGAPYIVASPLEVCFWPRGLAEFLRLDRSAFRVAAPNIGVPGAMQNIHERISAIDGYETLNIRRYKEYVDASQGGRPGPARLRDRKDRADAPGAQPQVRAPPRGRSAPGPAVWPGLRRRAHRRPRHERPPAACVRRAPRAPDPRSRRFARGAEGARRGGPGRGDPPRRPGRSPRRSRARRTPGRAGVVAEGPNEVRIEAALDRPGFLVVHDVYYPGWRAYLNGLEVPILRANHAFRAVHLGKGRHEVRFVYAPRSFAVGWRVSAVSALLVTAALLQAALDARRRTVSAVRR